MSQDTSIRNLTWRALLSTKSSSPIACLSIFIPTPQDGKRPESITIRLYANGEEAVGHVQTVTAADGWSWKFTDLPKFEDGEEIIYTISEDQVSGYQPEIDRYDITNSYTPGKVSVTVRKSWEDENDQDGIRPDTVKIRLFADGKDTGKTLVLSEENRWSGIFADLDEYKNGEKINYSITEDAVNGYQTVISGDAEKGFVVTNSHTPVKTENTPETGDRRTPALWIVLMGLAGTAIVTASYLAEKKRKTYRK